MIGSQENLFAFSYNTIKIPSKNDSTMTVGFKISFAKGRKKTFFM